MPLNIRWVTEHRHRLPRESAVPFLAHTWEGSVHAPGYGSRREALSEQVVAQGDLYRAFPESIILCVLWGFSSGVLPP